jgi:putative endonuclease
MLDKIFTKKGTKTIGDAAEALALTWLQKRGLVLVERNYRIARGPRSPGGEIDLILRDRAGTLIFAEVRSRGDASHGGAAASVGSRKQQSIVFAARHFLLKFNEPPACRFDVITVDGGDIDWLKGAFDGGS